MRAFGSVLMLTLAVLAGACAAPAPPGGVERTSWRLVEERGDELVLEVFAGHSSCLDYERVDVHEGADEVEVQAFVFYNGDVACTDDYGIEQVTVALAAPLGDRLLSGCSGPDVQWDGHPNDDGCRAGDT